MPTDLTDADWDAIKEAVAPFATNSGSAQVQVLTAVFRAGLAAGWARAIEDAAQVCDDLRWDHNGHPLASDEVSAEECAAAIRALNAASPES